MDQGNNNYLISPAKCNYLPYGKDFQDGFAPTGRFTNGKTPLDIIAGDLGIKDTVPAYLNPKNTDTDLLTGVSFDSGASGYDPCTSSLLKVIPMSYQLRMFEEYISKLQVIAGKERTSYVLGNSMFLVVAGTVDFATSYYLSGVRKSEYDVPSYADLLVGYASTFIQQIYKLGARKIGVFGMPPLGCVPYMRKLGGRNSKSCAEDQNEAALIYNAKLMKMLNSSIPNLPLSKVVYLDIYKAMLDIIHHPHSYGMEVVDKSCCSIGLQAAASVGGETCLDSSRLETKIYSSKLVKPLVKMPHLPQFGLKTVQDS
ncbi:hypothetical protein AgCh_032205 [Apium graveolens]